MDAVSLPLMLLFCALWWIPQNLQHEGAHALTAQYFGATITKIWPFPGMISGRWVWAYVQYVQVVRFTSVQEALVSAAPVITNTVSLIIYFTHLAFLSPLLASYVVLNSFLAAWAINNYVDGAYNLSTFYRRAPKMSTDGWKFWEASGFSHTALLIHTISWQLSFGILFLLFYFVI